jgi:4-amino-4-deoxy-L-arabinose transferase-like glycosyltransferase
VGTPPSFGGRLALLLLAGAALLSPGLSWGALERAEIYFMDGARSMLERGDWLVPYFRGEPFFDKPVLTYWLIAASFRAFGFSPEAARLVPAAATLSVLAATVWLGTLVFDRASALLGGVVLATSLSVLSFGRVAMSDTLLTLWSTLAAALWVLAYRPAAPAWVVPALGAVLGLGFQTKGPVALLLPGLGMLLFSWRRRGQGHGLPVTRSGLALAGLLFAVLGLGWFVAVYLRLGAEPLRWFFLRENLERFAGNTYDSGREPWFYLVTYLAQGFPWSAFLPLAVLAAVGRRGIAGNPSGEVWLLGWVGLALVPLSLSRGKIDYYLLPLYPPLSLVLGRYFAATAWRRRDRNWARIVLLLVAALALMAAAIPHRIPAGWLPPSGRLATFSILAGAGAAWCLWVARSAEPRRVATAVAGLTAVLYLAASTLLLPAFLGAQPNAAIVADVGREHAQRPAAELTLCEDPTRVQRELLFELRLVAVEDCDLWARMASHRPSLALAPEGMARSLEQAPRVRRVAGYRYLPSTALSLEGLLRPPAEDGLALLANYAPREPAARELWKQERRHKERVLRKRAQRIRQQARRDPSPLAGTGP